MRTIGSEARETAEREGGPGGGRSRAYGDPSGPTSRRERTLEDPEYGDGVYDTTAVSDTARFRPSRAGIWNISAVDCRASRAPSGPGEGAPPRRKMAVASAVAFARPVPMDDRS